MKNNSTLKKNQDLHKQMWGFFLMKFKNSKSLRADDSNPKGKFTENSHYSLVYKYFI